MQVYNSEHKDITQHFFQRFFIAWDNICPEIPIDPILAPTGYNREQLESGNHNAELNMYYKILTLAANSCWGSGFFLRLGDSCDILDLGILGYALISAANLQRSWEISSALLPHPIKTERSVVNNNIQIKLSPPKLNDDQAIALCEDWLASTWRWTCQRLPSIRDNPEVVISLHYPEPPHGYIYREMFPGQVLFDCSSSSFAFPAHFNELPFSTANASITRLCYEHSIATFPLLEEAGNLVDDVRLYLLQSAHIPFPTLEDAAESFTMPCHTFRRRLAKNGTTFRQIVSESRMALSRQYLLETELSISEISYLTGYEHPPSFYRAFLKYYKVTPEIYRGRR